MFNKAFVGPQRETFTANRKRDLPRLVPPKAWGGGWGVYIVSRPHPDPKWSRHATIWVTGYSPPLNQALKWLYGDQIMDFINKPSPFLALIQKGEWIDTVPLSFSTLTTSAQQTTQFEQIHNKRKQHEKAIGSIILRRLTNFLQRQH